MASQNGSIYRKHGGPEDGNSAGQQANARFVATTVLHRVLNQGAYASQALDAELSRARCPRQEASLATEIVYGSLRTLPHLKARLDGHLKDPRRLDPFTYAALLVGAYQILFLDRVPVFAAVHETVELVRKRRGPRLGGLTNAVLRRLDRPARPTAPALMVTPWLRQTLERGLGPERAGAFMEQAQRPPPIGLRVRPSFDADQEREAIAHAHPDASVRAARLCPQAILVRGVGDPRALPAVSAGRVLVQEQGAQLVGALARVGPNDRVADLCAGHGGKSLSLADAVGPGGSVTAIDIDERKLERAETNARRLGLEDRLRTSALDLRVGVADLGPDFDHVLLDAPCSGLGTLNRRPEIALRLDPKDPARLGALGQSLLQQAIRLVRPGGRLTYAVCTLTREEGPDVLKAFMDATPGWQLDAELGAPFGLHADPDGVLRVGPWLTDPPDDLDGYQVFQVRKETEQK